MAKMTSSPRKYWVSCYIIRSKRPQDVRNLDVALALLTDAVSVQTPVLSWQATRTNQSSTVNSASDTARWFGLRMWWDSPLSVGSATARSNPRRSSSSAYPLISEALTLAKSVQTLLSPEAFRRYHRWQGTRGHYPRPSPTR